MDCLEFRRLLGIDPRVGDSAARGHLDSCPFCADAHSRAQAFETRLAFAMSLPVPEGLADRILLAQLTGERQRQRTNRRRLGWVALAAAATLVIAIGVVRQQQRPTAAALSDLVAEHVTGPHERDALRRQAPLPDSMVRHAFADRGVELAAVPGGISYVNECPVGGYRSVHMVMPRDGEPVSVVYVTKHRVPDSEDFQRDGLKGREVPIADGTLVMLAQNSDSFGALEHSWRDALEGPPKLAAADSP
ncbi:MAG: DUF3379 family protein [Dokdonella sp.]